MTANLQPVGSKMESNDLVVLSHLRWDFVFHRPQHVMSRFAKCRRVFFFEEPLFEELNTSCLSMSLSEQGVYRVVPLLPQGTLPQQIPLLLEQLINELLLKENIKDYTLWYYTPMAMEFTRHLNPRAILYDCMDELSLFKGAPLNLLENEKELFQRASLVFTGGHSLYEYKKRWHDNIYPVPSSIDRNHFMKARRSQIESESQKIIPWPRLGFFGILDERLDIDLLRKIAQLRPHWQYIMIGPIVKIDPTDLPREQNIYYLGPKSYEELPNYLAGWDVALLPFANNPSTRFISPTKTPEYLAAGCPVVSTSLQDVVHPYGFKKLVHIADEPSHFITACEKALIQKKEKGWLARVDQFLGDKSWDETWKQMAELETLTQQRRELPSSDPSALVTPSYGRTPFKKIDLMTGWH